MERQYRFGFIFLDEIHHINHFITLAVSLSRDHSVAILTYPSSHTYLKNKLDTLGGHKVEIKKLKTHPFRRFTDRLKKRNTPRKGFWMRHNRHHLLQGYDALFFTDYIHHKLLRFRGDSQFPKFIKIPHGPAGRAYGYKKDLLDFDMHLIFGEHYYNQLEMSDLLGKRTRVAGYFKNDALKGQEYKPLFKNTKPVVLYNPHFDQEVSSWYTHGIEILEYFKNQNLYNLIFAPHINLFNKADIKYDESVLETYKNVSNIYIDTGSISCVDMVYTKMAAIYLGDVSSQAIEFIIEPRPCIFINAHNANYKENHNYHFWKYGQVVQSLTGLDTALHKAFESFPLYESLQSQSSESNFKTEKNSTATSRGVEEVLKFMDESNL